MVDAAGMLILPGGIDVHTHLDMPFGGTVSADDYEWGTRAAAIGGTTTVIDFALQSMGKPMTEAFKTWRAKSEGKACIDYALHMAVTDLGPNDAWLDDVDAMVAEGITSFKIFMAYPNVLMVNDATISSSRMQRTAKLGALVCVHAENGTVIDVVVQETLAAGNTGPLSANAYQGAQFGRALHQLEDRRVVHHQDIRIGHEDFERPRRSSS